MEDEATVRAVLDIAPGILVVDEAYGQFAPRSADVDVQAGRPLVEGLLRRAQVEPDGKGRERDASQAGEGNEPDDLIDVEQPALTVWPQAALPSSPCA